MRSRALVYSLVGVLLVAVLSFGATFVAGKAPLLGLDLKGGVSIVEKPTGKVNSNILTEAGNIIENRVNGLGVSNANVTQQGSDIVIELPGAKNDTQILSTLGETAQLFYRPVDCLIPPYQGVVSSKTSKTTTGTTTPKSKTGGASKSSTSVPAKVKPKAKATPVNGPTATTSKKAFGPEQHIDAKLASVQVPLASTGTAQGKTAQGKTAGTSVRTTVAPVHKSVPPKTPVTATTAPVSTTRPVTTTTSLGQAICGASPAQQAGYMPAHGDSHGLTPPIWDKRNDTVVLPMYSDFGVKGNHYTPDYRYVLGPAEMDGSIVSSASAQLNVQNDQWQVNLTFTSKGSNLFNKYAAAHYQCYEQNTKQPPYCADQAIELDGLVESAPSIDAATFNGSAEISGAFTAQQAQNLANALNYGSLPVTFVAQDFSNVSPQIGTDSLRAGAIAGAVAVLLVLLYLLIYYRALGLVVVLGICMSGALLYAITTLLSYTEGLALTLSGVIGLIVSVGVTADSCVVYFERLKEEIRSGRTVRSSVEKSFSRAFRTILAADFSSFIAALVLYALTVGDVRGFAFFLGLATLLNVVTTYFFTRPLVVLIGHRSAVTGGGALGVSRGLGAALNS
ncbi:MAG TPA: protein translocase subunit SecD [Acidimicrobiales bacterium]|nr:protein translocase subunit SecD [Acidimicrobiales bacterium]